MNVWEQSSHENSNTRLSVMILMRYLDVDEKQNPFTGIWGKTNRIYIHQGLRESHYFRLGDVLEATESSYLCFTSQNLKFDLNSP